MGWRDDLLELALWALQSEDLRHRFRYADEASELSEMPGIDHALEVVAVLAIYEAALGKGYKWGETLEYEKPYPSEEGGNPKRADLAFKNEGVGQNWAYVEVKKYGNNGKSLIESDIKKLNQIKNRAQRWMLVYRIRERDSRAKPLELLLQRNFKGFLSIHGHKSFQTITNDHEPGVCDICLAKIK